MTMARDSSCGVYSSPRPISLIGLNLWGQKSVAGCRSQNDPRPIFGGKFLHKFSKWPFVNIRKVHHDAMVKPIDPTSGIFQVMLVVLRLKFFRAMLYWGSRLADNTRSPLDREWS